MNKKKTSFLAAVVGVLAIVGIVVGVNHSSSSDNHNTTDVAFAQDMIPHHRQAVQMAQFVGTRSVDPKVKALASEIEAAQSPEITAMSDWLRSWGTSVPGNESAAGGMGSMQGMMSDADMSSLQTLSGAAFDKMWLTMMTAHHTGAIDMAKTETTSGKFLAAKALARTITSSQSAQIAQMQQLLKQF